MEFLKLNENEGTPYQSIKAMSGNSGASYYHFVVNIVILLSHQFFLERMNFNLYLSPNPLRRACLIYFGLIMNESVFICEMRDIFLMHSGSNFIGFSEGFSFVQAVAH